MIILNGRSNAARSLSKSRPKRDLPRPTDGRCVGCGHRVGTQHLKWHHCHDCGEFIAWLCNDCNLALTEHALKNWDRLASVHEHECVVHPRLFEVEHVRGQPVDNPWTRPLRMSNGGGDDRYVTVSTVDGYITVEQLAVVMGVNANTARDVASGRQSNHLGIGVKHGSTWLIPYSDALAHLEQRWRMK